MIQSLPDKKKRSPNAIVIVPTREIALQVADVFRKLIAGTGLRVVSLYKNPSVHVSLKNGQLKTKAKGQVGNIRQIAKLKKGCNIIVSTIGQLLYVMKMGAIKTSFD